MESIELRLGNFIQDEFGIVEQVESLNSFGCEEINENSVTGFYEPILLNSEWLLKFGFEPSGTSWLRNTGNYGYFDIELMDEHYFLNYEGLPFSNGFKYVHQLQNLYFAVTGKELTIKKLKYE
jgi:hypothetical protein